MAGDKFHQMKADPKIMTNCCKTRMCMRAVRAYGTPVKKYLSAKKVICVATNMIISARSIRRIFAHRQIILISTSKAMRSRTQPTRIPCKLYTVKVIFTLLHALLCIPAYLQMENKLIAHQYPSVHVSQLSNRYVGNLNRWTVP